MKASVPHEEGGGKVSKKVWKGVDPQEEGVGRRQIPRKKV